MNLGIYKPGQGYWVRVMSAVLGSLLTFALAAWVYGQMQVVADRLPKAAYNIGFAAEQPGAFAVGDNVELTSRPDSTGSAVTIGTATVSAAGERKLVTVRDFKPALNASGVQVADISSAGVIRKTVEGSKPVTLVSSGAVAGIAPVDPAILAGGVSIGVVLVGAILCYWLVGLRARTVEFLIATDFEMKKVNWSTPREIMGHTWVVIGTCILLATALFLVDIALKSAFTAIRLFE